MSNDAIAICTPVGETFNFVDCEYDISSASDNSQVTVKVLHGNEQIPTRAYGELLTNINMLDICYLADCSDGETLNPDGTYSFEVKGNPFITDIAYNGLSRI